MENFESSPYPFLVKPQRDWMKMANRLFWGHFFSRKPACTAVLSDILHLEINSQRPHADTVNPTSIIEVLCFNSHYRLRGILAGWDIAFPHIKKRRRWDVLQRLNIYVFTWSFIFPEWIVCSPSYTIDRTILVTIRNRQCSIWSRLVNCPIIEAQRVISRILLEPIEFRPMEILSTKESNWHFPRSPGVILSFRYSFSDCPDHRSLPRMTLGSFLSWFFVSLRELQKITGSSDVHSWFQSHFSTSQEEGSGYPNR